MTITLNLDPTNWLEATWFEQTTGPDVVIPAKDAVFDDDGNEISPAEPERTEPGHVTKTAIKCVSYHPTQVDMLRSDIALLGTTLSIEQETLVSEWVENYVPEPPAALTLSDYDAALTQHLDAVAQSRRWADRISLMSRAGFPGPWQADAIAFGTWADGCNVIGYQLLADYQAGTIPQPTISEMLALLPEMVWPIQP